MYWQRSARHFKQSAKGAELRTETKLVSKPEVLANNCLFQVSGSKSGGGTGRTVPSQHCWSLYMFQIWLCLFCVFVCFFECLFVCLFFSVVAFVTLAKNCKRAIVHQDLSETANVMFAIWMFGAAAGSRLSSLWQQCKNSSPTHRMMYRFPGSCLWAALCSKCQKKII